VDFMPTFKYLFIANRSTNFVYARLNAASSVSDSRRMKTSGHRSSTLAVAFEVNGKI